MQFAVLGGSQGPNGSGLCSSPDHVFIDRDKWSDGDRGQANNDRPEEGTWSDRTLKGAVSSGCAAEEKGPVYRKAQQSEQDGRRAANEAARAACLRYKKRRRAVPQDEV